MASQETLDIGEFTAHLRNTVLPMGLNIDDIRIYGSKIRLIHPPFSAAMSQPGKLEVFVSSGSLAAFLEKLGPAGLRDFRVEAADDRIVVRAVKVVLIPIASTAVARLRIHEGRQLFIELDSVEVAGGAPLKNLVQGQLDQINPVLDVAQLPFVKARLTGVTMDRGGIVVTGEVEA